MNNAYRGFVAAAVILTVAQIGCRYADVATPQPPSSNPSLLSQSARQKSKKAVPSIQMALARSLEKQGKTERAIMAYRKLATKHDLPQAHHRLAVLYDQTGQFEDAEGSYQRALEQDPRNAEILCDVGYSQYLRKRWNQSEQYLRRAIELKPDLRRAQNNLGLLLARQGRRDEALEVFSRAGTDAADAHSNLAYALLSENQTDAAREHVQLALNAEKDHQIARNLMTVIRRAEIAQAVPSVKLQGNEDEILTHERHIDVASVAQQPNRLPSDDEVLTTNTSAVQPAAYKEQDERRSLSTDVQQMHQVDMRAFRAPALLPVGP